MRRFNTTQECNAYYLDFLVAMRAWPGFALKVFYLNSQAERGAWQADVFRAYAADPLTMEIL